MTSEHPLPPPDPGWPTIGAMHTMLVNIDRQLAVALTQFQETREDLIEHKADSCRIHDRHQQKIDALSHWRWWLTGGIGALTFLVIFFGRPLVALAIGG